jgi:CRISPR system Cascade subunit CasE
MKQLYMVEIWPDITALLRFLHGQGLATRDGDEDLGYGIHAWLAAAFGKLSPKPWRLLIDRRRPARILGYSHVSAQELQQYMSEFAEPSVCAVCPPESIASRMMPDWMPGRKLAFELMCCPVGRKAGSGIEKDIFLIHADTSEKGTLSRDTVYCSWAKERLQSGQAAIVTSISLVGFTKIDRQ